MGVYIIEENDQNYCDGGLRLDLVDELLDAFAAGGGRNRYQYFVAKSIIVYNNTKKHLSKR